MKTIQRKRDLEKLLVLIDDKILLKKIQDLLARKKSGVEMGKEKAIPEINDFIKIPP